MTFEDLSHPKAFCDSIPCVSLTGTIPPQLSSQEREFAGEKEPSTSHLCDMHTVASFTRLIFNPDLEMLLLEAPFLI